MIVRRGALRRFDRLKRETADLGVDVIWDRRGEDRKSQSSPRPKTDRRKRTPFTWDAADFVVTDKPGTPRKRSPAKKESKKK